MFLSCPLSPGCISQYGCCCVLTLISLPLSEHQISILLPDKIACWKLFCNSQIYHIQIWWAPFSSRACIFLENIFQESVYNRLFLFVWEKQHTFQLFFSRRKNGLKHILFCCQLHSNRSSRLFLPWWTFHQDEFCPWLLDLPEDEADFKKTEYFFVHSLIVHLVTLTLSCCQRGFCTLLKDIPSSCMWIEIGRASCRERV